MSFRISPGATGAIVVLEGDGDRLEVWASHGFNALRWQVRSGDAWGDLLDVAPDWEANPVPTRSGHPVLFPFPNRLRDGKLHFAGREYDLPKTESSGRHAIHGFTPRTPWRVVATDAHDDFASVTGELQLSRDLPGQRGHWPADFVIRLTYELRPNRLAVVTEVENPDDVPLPFGLGFHGYFKLPDATGVGADGMTLWADTARLWVTDSGLATGEQVPVPDADDFRRTLVIGERVLDSLYARAEGATGRAAMLTAPGRGTLTVSADADFGEVLLFTPPHRRAVAVEPYTCPSDAANLYSAGRGVGWRVLPPGGRWRGSVEYSWTG